MTPIFSVSHLEPNHTRVKSSVVTQVRTDTTQQNAQAQGEQTESNRQLTQRETSKENNKLCGDIPTNLDIRKRDRTQQECTHMPKRSLSLALSRACLMPASCLQHDPLPILPLPSLVPPCFFFTLAPVFHNRPLLFHLLFA